MAVPLFDLKQQTALLEPELRETFERVLRSGSYILGAEVDLFEKEVAQFLQVPHALGVSSGTDAILLALMALEVGLGDEVICPSFTFFATAGCVARLGATPVFADSCPDCFNLSPADVRQKVTPKTKAIIPVHLFGQSAEMDQLTQIAREFDLWLIEDAAQSIGAQYKETQSGTMGDFGCYSFFPTKNLGAFGDAGLLVTHDEELAERARVLRVHGAKPKYVHHFIGGNFRIDAMQAAFLRVKLPHLSAYVERRQTNAQLYNEKLSRAPNVSQNRTGFCSCDGVLTDDKPGALRLPFANRNAVHTYNQYTVRVSGGRRDDLRKHLSNLEIGSEVYYPIPLHEQMCFASLQTSTQLPVAELLSQEVLSLPIYPELEVSYLAEVADAVINFHE